MDSFFNPFSCCYCAFLSRFYVGSSYILIDSLLISVPIRLGFGDTDLFGLKLLHNHVDLLRAPRLSFLQL